MQEDGITPFAISPDPPELLARFAKKYAITYPLLSDSDSRVIRDYDIFNTHIPADHDWYGIPFPGTYMVDERGRVFDRTFFADHAVRESINNMLQESFRLADAECGEVQVVQTPHLRARAYFASPTLRPAQLNMLTVEIELRSDMHVYGHPLPDGYIPIELNVEESDGLQALDITYPQAQPLRFDLIDETLPAHAGTFTIKARCRGGRREEGQIRVDASLRYQACDAQECYLPQTLHFDLPLKFMGHDWDRLD